MTAILTNIIDPVLAATAARLTAAHQPRPNEPERCVVTDCGRVWPCMTFRFAEQAAMAARGTLVQAHTCRHDLAVAGVKVAG